MKNRRITDLDVKEYKSSALWDSLLQKEILQAADKYWISIIFDGTETLFPGFLFTLQEKTKKLFFSIELQRTSNLASFVKNVPFWILRDLHILPHSFNPRDGSTLTCRELRNKVSYLKESGAKGAPLPYRDYARKTSDLRFEERWSSVAIGSVKPLKISVIIPTRNYETFLINSLRHLIDQSLTAQDYEVIIVDDASSDDSFLKVQLLMGSLSSKFNFKYIYCPRDENEQNLFRAGHCRNIGLSFATGEWILFLDSDMLVPRDFLQQLLSNDSQADVIQCPRQHIKPEKSSQDTSLDNLADTDTYLEEPQYWGAFFQAAKWEEMPFAWRYTCTYCLAIRRSALDEVGHFRNVFTSYGFEDTELGYRLYKAGYRFLLWKKKVYHLTPPAEKSRYYHSMWIKQHLLSKTGKIFFLSTLDLEVYHLFQLYMGGESRLLQKWHGLFK